MAAGDASISGLGSALRSDCEAGLPTETGSGLLRRKVPLRTESRMGPGNMFPSTQLPGRSVRP
jgi:hypothetical protein